MMFICSFKAAMECAMEYAQKREAFGRPISKFQTIQVYTFCSNFDYIVRKSAFCGFLTSQASIKPICVATDDGWRLEILIIETREIE